MKKIITLILFFVITGLTKQGLAQAPVWDWVHSSGGTMEDNGKSVATDANNNVFVTGFYRSATIAFGSFTLTNADPSGSTDDVFLVKYSPTGLALWATRFGESGNDEGTAISTDGAGNVYVAGNFTSASIEISTYTLTNADSMAQHYDIFLGKFDSSGNVLWFKSYGGNSDDNANGINTDISGNTFLTGSFSSDTIRFDTTAFASSGNLDIFLTKLNVLGDVLWARSAGGDGEDKSLSVSSDSLGNIGITGYFYSNHFNFGTLSLMKTDTTMDTLGGQTNDVFVAKYNAMGDLLWAKKAGSYGGYFDEVSSNAISMNKAGEIFITGYFRYDSISFDGWNLYDFNTSRDFFIAKYDTTGNILWAQSSGDFLDDEGRGIIVDAQGDFLVTGYYSSGTISFDGNTLTNPNFDSEIFVVKFDSNGNYMWATQAGGTTGDIGNSIATQGTNNVYVTGQYYSSTAAFGSFNITNSGFGDIFVSRLYAYSSVGMDNRNPNKNELSVYPNPSNNFSTIIYSLKTSNDIKMDIYNELGEKVITLVNNVKQAEGDYHYTFSAPDPGIYIVKLQTSEGGITQKVIFTN